MADTFSYEEATAPSRTFSYEEATAAHAQPKIENIKPSTWSSLRAYVAPVADVVGVVGGGLLGAPAGPFGAVAGAGLGLAGSKELLNIADTYFGDKPQDTPANALARVGGNVAEGASYEMGGQIIAKPLGYVLGKASNLLADMSSKNKAAKILREAVGTDRDVVQNALAASPDILPAQAVAGKNLPEVQALAEMASARTPKPFDRVLAQQRAQTISELEALAKGGTQTEARASQEAAKSATNATLIPMRDEALRSANTAGEMLPGLARERQSARQLPHYQPACAWAVLESTPTWVSLRALQTNGRAKQRTHHLILVPAPGSRAMLRIA